jgi:hypothetical protein
MLVCAGAPDCVCERVGTSVRVYVCTYGHSGGDIVGKGGVAGQALDEAAVDAVGECEQGLGSREDGAHARVVAINGRRQQTERARNCGRRAAVAPLITWLAHTRRGLCTRTHRQKDTRTPPQHVWTTQIHISAPTHRSGLERAAAVTVGGSGGGAARVARRSSGQGHLLRQYTWACVAGRVPVGAPRRHPRCHVDLGVVLLSGGQHDARHCNQACAQRTVRTGA